MYVALAQINYHVGNFKSNVARVVHSIASAKEMGADLVVFSELSICGYPPRDFLEFDDFIEKCEEAIAAIAANCIGIAAIIGAPCRNKTGKGKPLFNSAYFLAGGKIQSVHHKALLPNYDVFDEYRYFEPSTEVQTVNYKNTSIAITICEDLWNVGDKHLYTYCPMDHLAKQNPGLIVNISASPFSYTHREERLEVFSKNASKYNVPLVFVNHVGAQTELIFDGGSFVINKEGKLAAELEYFKEDLKVFNLDALPKVEIKLLNKEQRIFSALILGISDYFHKSGLNKAILGLSGGIDSALTLVLAVKALGKENVHALLMPSKFSSGHSVEDAKQLANNIGCGYDVIGIEDIAETFERALQPRFKDLPFSVAEENIQARARGILLMGLANKFGYVLLNTSNKSEMAVGYGTLYGDMAGGLSVLGDVYKTQVYGLARLINSKKEVIPHNILEKPPSAELRPDQKDSDSLPDYTVLDKILYQYIELRKGPKDIMAMGFDEVLVKKVLKMVNTNEYKRHQTAPILRVSSKAFGMGRRMPIVGKYLG